MVGRPKIGRNPVRESENSWGRLRAWSAQAPVSKRQQSVVVHVAARSAPDRSDSPVAVYCSRAKAEAETFGLADVRV